MQIRPSITANQPGAPHDVTSWGPVAITCEQQTAALVFVSDGRRSVMVTALSPITAAQVQASLAMAP